MNPAGLALAVPPRARAATDRQPWADLVRVYAIAAVVLLHCETVPNTRFGSIPLGDWWQTNLYNAWVCTCVPLFVMLSGALLLPREAAGSGEFLRRAGRLVPPLLAWTLIYAAWIRFGWGSPLTAGDLLRHLASGYSAPLFPHLWFLYLIISLYLLAPFLGVYFRHAGEGSLAYVLALWFLAGTVKPLAQRAGFEPGVVLDPVFGFVGYFLLGAALARHCPTRCPPRGVAACWGALLAGYAANLYGTYALSAAAGRLDDYFYQPVAPTVMVMSGASFLLLRHYGSAPGAPWRLALAGLSRLAVGIYLSHALVIVLLDSGRLGFRLHDAMLPPLFAAPLLAAAVLAASAALAAALRLTPAGRWLAP